MLSATFKIVQKARSSERSHSAARNCARSSIGGLSDPGGARATLGASDDKRTRADAD